MLLLEMYVQHLLVDASKQLIARQHSLDVAAAEARARSPPQVGFGTAAGSHMKDTSWNRHMQDSTSTSMS